ncbi:hypothetical protein Q428_07305 [Fervidicella metallireducens AeB]|uniref:Uncharacterized protein n=1 Tax=Fervidicella metallireducens AeB TaxID=1403537 RepID=A0A017RVI1_9CLOT|nr:abortive infection system antitoxin AbiGi family protein [Fervidicella metallireducens]EYE88581.1 hypothetical protein Q428_07305 [Fervidicella metallireducens AeB]
MSGSTISANALFHFTNDLIEIEDSLINGFYPRYCLEDFSYLFSKEKTKENYKYAVPMICFCDIPLSQIKKHIAYYGRYAIGLSKEWGRKNKINPVMYILEESLPTTYLREIFELFYDNDSSFFDCDYKNQKGDKLNTIAAYFNQFTTYLKPYENFRDNKTAEVKYYDEREWRYVPDINELIRLGLPLKLGEYKFVKEVDAFNKILYKNCRLSFNYEDLKYIIVSREKEVYDMVERIDKIDNSIFSCVAKRLLYTKIISLEKILQDF